MKKTIATEKIIVAAKILSDEKTRLSKMDEADKFAVVRTLRTTRAIVEDMEKFQNDARERLKPENFDELQRQAQRFDSLSDDEKVALNKSLMEYDSAVRRCVADELASEKEIEVYPLSSDGFNKFMASNEDMPAASFLAVLDLMEE